MPRQASEERMPPTSHGASGRRSPPQRLTALTALALAASPAACAPPVSYPATAPLCIPLALSENHNRCFDEEIVRALTNEGFVVTSGGPGPGIHLEVYYRGHGEFLLTWGDHGAAPWLLLDEHMSTEELAERVVPFVESRMRWAYANSGGCLSSFGGPGALRLPQHRNFCDADSPTANASPPRPCPQP